MYVFLKNRQAVFFDQYFVKSTFICGATSLCKGDSNKGFANKASGGGDFADIQRKDHGPQATELQASSHQASSKAVIDKTLCKTLQNMTCVFFSDQETCLPVTRF